MLKAHTFLYGEGRRISVIVVLAFTGAPPSQLLHPRLESCIETGMTSKGQITGVPTLVLLSQNLGGGKSTAGLGMCTPLGTL